MAKRYKIRKERKPFKKEYLSLFLSFIILGLLIVGLIFVIKKSPDINKVEQTSNTLSVEDIAIGGANDYCEGYNVDEYKKRAKDIYLSYEEVPDIYMGQDVDVDMPELMIDIYADGLKVNVMNTFENLRIKVILYYSDIHPGKQDTEYTFYTNDPMNKTISFTETSLTARVSMTVRVYLDEPNCYNLLLREFNLTLPRYNILYRYDACQKEKLKGDSRCAMYVFNDNDYNEDMDVYDKIKKSLNAPEDENENKESIFSIRNGIRLLVAILFVVGLVVFIKKGRK